MNHDEWQQALKNAYNGNTRNRPIKLPSSQNIQFSGSKDNLRIHLKPSAILSNMQYNCAAFESWALAIYTWCEIKSVEISWDAVPLPPRHRHGDPHYNRFLYRAHRFCSMFPWANIATQNTSMIDEANALTAERLVLNYASEARGPRGKDYPEARLEAAIYNLEIHLPEFLSEMRPNRQLPVGLFVGEVSENNAIFTGKASAIDLCGIDSSKRAWVFELKAADNDDIGIVSELLFYANLIRDAINPNNTQIHFSGEDLPLYKQLLQCQEVVACFLTVDELHPLLHESRVLNQLNSVQLVGGIPIRFCSARVDQNQNRVVMAEYDAI